MFESRLAPDSARGTMMTAVCAPYTLLRRAGEAQSPAAPPAERRAGLLREDVRQIIEQRHFSLAFQPVVRLSDRTVAAHEALLRLHPPAGLPKLPTGVFVELAAGWGLAQALDTAVLEMALGARGAAMSANIAGRSLQDAAFMRRAISLIGDAAPRLLIEVTAAAGIDDMAAMAHGVAALQAAGVLVCLDDLGADAATLDCMRAVRFDQVKFAGTVVRAAAGGERGRRLAAALVALAAAVGAETVAKSVETLPQAWQMQELGVRHGQGWLFGSPGKLAD
jgi:EAL domain-containing protein (putative c-di-GMP-specific phosphodiesterase class I)